MEKKHIVNYNAIFASPNNHMSSIKTLEIENQLNSKLDNYNIENFSFDQNINSAIRVEL